VDAAGAGAQDALDAMHCDAVCAEPDERAGGACARRGAKWVLGGRDQGGLITSCCLRRHAGGVGGDEGCRGGVEGRRWREDVRLVRLMSTTSVVA
jgi:hypothetical protein